MSGEFVNLHRHDSYSLFDGLDLPIRAADRAKALGQSALGLTNHGTCFGIIEHYRVCEEKGIKPILGMEAYVTLKGDKPTKRVKLAHQTLLVQNYEGYRNLMRLVTKSYDYFHYKPRIPLSLLREHGEGLIVLSGCPSSLLQRYLLAEKYEQAELLFKWFRDAFGDRFYAEVQHHELARKTGKALLHLAEKYKVPMVATNDAHYVDPEDKVVHDLLLKLRRSGQGEENPTYGVGFHMPSREEMEKYLHAAHDWASASQVKDMLDRTTEIAGRVDLNLDAHKPERMLPPLWGDNPGAKLEALAAEGIRRAGLHKERVYVERLREELRVIRKLRYEEYFHVCYEVTSWARQQGIMVGPRGSVCGSLLAYVLGVTMVDPLVHGTLFERFLHDQKQSFPDVDLDIDSRYKDTVTDWALERYKPYILPIITFGRYGGGNISNDLHKAFPDVIDSDRKNRLRFAIEQIKHDHVFVIDWDVIENYPIFDVLEEELPGLKRMVLKMYNMARYIGRHPGGVVFVPGEHDRWLPKVVIRDREMSSYNFFDVEYVGLLKFDMLGLSSISTIRSTLDLVQSRHGNTITLEDIKLDSSECYQRFSLGQTDGIFQFETRGGRAILQQIEPDNFQELAASTALNRPGVSANLAKYVAGKRAGRTGGFFGDTFGVPVYQEQLAKLLRHLGFEWVKVDKFLKSLKINVKTYAITTEKQLGSDIFTEIVDRLAEQGYNRGKAEALVDRIKQYSFNKAHAVGYSLVAYWMMWLRVHYPIEFWCSLLNNEYDEKKRKAYEATAIHDGAAMLPAHVNGTAQYSVDGNAIRVGTKTISGVGEKAAESIEKGRPYHRAHDIRKLPRRVVNARVIKALAGAGALYMNYEKQREVAVKYNVERQEMNRGILLRGGAASKAVSQ